MNRIRHGSAGFTLIEVVVVCAIIGILALLAYPNMVRFSAQQQTKASATQIAGLLDHARSRAVSESTPHLVYVNPKSIDANGNCGAMAVVVRDSDRSYSITAGDGIREVELDPRACHTTQPFGEGETAADASVPLPGEDLAVRALEPSGEILPLTGDESGQQQGGPGESELSSETLANLVVNGATFPIDAASGRPVIAFSERGIPVDPANPTAWGSGAGAIYLTDSYSTVYAAVVQPLGAVRLRVFDRVSGKWR